MLPELTYWNPRVLDKPFCPLHQHRYLTFDTDQGGLSNIRLAFEYVAVLAAITGRTLVLPPPEPWYLVNNGPKHVGKKEGVTQFSDIMDISALQEIIPVISTEQFIEESAEHLSIPIEFQSREYFSRDNEKRRPWRQWKQWLLDNVEIAKDWNPHETLICFPNQESIDTDQISDQYREKRRLIEFSPRLKRSACDPLSE